MVPTVNNGSKTKFSFAKSLKEPNLQSLSANINLRLIDLDINLCKTKSFKTPLTVEIVSAKGLLSSLK